MNTKVVRFAIIILVIVVFLWAYKAMYKTPVQKQVGQQSVGQNAQKIKDQAAQESGNRAIQKAVNAANPFLIENPLNHINITPADVANPFAQ